MTQNSDSLETTLESTRPTMRNVGIVLHCLLMLVLPTLFGITVLTYDSGSSSSTHGVIVLVTGALAFLYDAGGILSYKLVDDELSY